MVTCPRCNGKGFVDESDIERLEMQAFWEPGKCRYCNESGQVTEETLRTRKVANPLDTHKTTQWYAVNALIWIVIIGTMAWMIAMFLKPR